jgi:hypothetical protein
MDKGNGAGTVWNIAFPGKGQVRVDEKDMEFPPPNNPD